MPDVLFSREGVGRNHSVVAEPSVEFRQERPRLFENCIASTKSKYSIQFKLLRVVGGCLGARSR